MFSWATHSYQPSTPGSLQAGGGNAKPSRPLPAVGILRRIAYLCSYQFSTYLGGNSGDQWRAVAVSAHGIFHVVGNTQSSTFPTANTFQNDFNGGGPNIVFLFRVSME